MFHFKSKSKGLLDIYFVRPTDPKEIDYIENKIKEFDQVGWK